MLLDHYIHALHPWSAFLIMPVFAFFNAGVSFAGVEPGKLLDNSVFLGIALGLLIGKPVGILVCTKLATLSGLAKMPAGVTWIQVVGVGLLAGIGFTMSLFIGSLAFDDPSLKVFSKMGVLAASLIAMVVGYFTLKISLTEKEAVNQS